MRAATTISDWLPDRSPTWTDVLVGAVAVWLLATNLLLRESVAWTWVAVGALATTLAVGPGANSVAGAQVGRWFRDIGLLGRVVVIVLFALAVALVRLTVDVPETPVNSFVAGGMLVIASFVAVHLLTSGEISGWRAT